MHYYYHAQHACSFIMQCYGLEMSCENRLMTVLINAPPGRIIDALLSFASSLAHRHSNLVRSGGVQYIIRRGPCMRTAYHERIHHTPHRHFGHEAVEHTSQVEILNI